MKFKVTETAKKLLENQPRSTSRAHTFATAKAVAIKTAPFAPRVIRQSAKEPGAPTLLEETGIPGSALIHSLPTFAEPARHYTPGTRALREIPRAEQRTLEVRLYYGRKNGKSDERLSNELDIQPGQLDALAATSGEL